MAPETVTTSPMAVVCAAVEQLQARFFELLSAAELFRAAWRWHPLRARERAARSGHRAGHSGAGRLDPAVFGFCYHSAHDQIGGPRPFTLLRRLGVRLIAVQLSDRIRDYVDHVLPGDGFIDWPGLCAELRQSAFRGPVLLEVATTHSAEKDTRRFLRRAHASACQLATWMARMPTDGAVHAAPL